ncbi:hypothetical protein BO79DRAFT_67810 [Aspergillus costaricaensis CBS 115574]|uniref:Uncharacterized protein n=1 Tax=Aspergillus costaricaensis CBS 115574 TaxID=1448317 RepID=A0ACD1HZT5_9EURO|nr:hypothetical protein BO79DRAFT_67810 [Aspergillus costaricaensis CBS 115574]RAK83521.1 hypothetical protein BO79DRAFT_67810 [Aspergillus costaricaensis CBS 115574]
MIPAVEAPFPVSCILVTLVCPMYSCFMLSFVLHSCCSADRRSTRFIEDNDVYHACVDYSDVSFGVVSVYHIYLWLACTLLSVCLGDTVIFSISFQLSLRGDEEYQGLAFWMI